MGQTVTARTVRRVWLIAAAAAMWLLAAATPALAQPVQPIVGQMSVGRFVGLFFEWGRWAVLIAAGIALLKTWFAAAKTGGKAPFTKMIGLAAGGALMFYFFTEQGINLLATSGEQVASDVQTEISSATTLVIKTP